MKRRTIRRPAEDPDRVWRALASPLRREVLDLLRTGPRTTGEIAAALPGTRYAAMKHIAVLAGAGLLSVERRGRERWNHLNAVPLLRVLRRWVGRYAEARAEVLLRFAAAARRGEVRNPGSPGKRGRKGRGRK